MRRAARKRRQRRIGLWIWERFCPENYVLTSKGIPVTDTKTIRVIGGPLDALNFIRRQHKEKPAHE